MVAHDQTLATLKTFLPDAGSGSGFQAACTLGGLCVSVSVFFSVQACVPCGLNSLVDLRRAVDFLSFSFFFAVRTGIDDIHALYLLKRLTYFLKENFVSQLLRLIF